MPRHASGEESLLRQVLLMALWGIVGVIVPPRDGVRQPRALWRGRRGGVGTGQCGGVSRDRDGIPAAGGGGFPAAVSGGRGGRGRDPLVAQWPEKVTGSALFAPAAAFLATGFTGMAMALMGKPDFLEILTVISESLLAGGFAYFVQVAFRITHQMPDATLTAPEQASMVAVAAVALMALSTVQFSGISPGRIVSILVILVFARCGREQGGSIAGIVLGTAMALAARSRCSWRGLCPRRAAGGPFSRFGKLASAASLRRGEYGGEPQRQSRAGGGRGLL